MPISWPNRSTPWARFWPAHGCCALLAISGKNHPCCVVATHEEAITARPEWVQAVTNAVVRGAIYASQNKAEVAQMISRDGKGYLPAPAEVVIRAMTHYDTAEYADSGALTHADWNNGRIDFQPWPYPSADALTVFFTCAKPWCRVTRPS